MDFGLKFLIKLTLNLTLLSFFHECRPNNISTCHIQLLWFLSYNIIIWCTCYYGIENSLAVTRVNVYNIISSSRLLILRANSSHKTWNYSTKEENIIKNRIKTFFSPLTFRTYKHGEKNLLNFYHVNCLAICVVYMYIYLPTHYISVLILHIRCRVYIQSFFHREKLTRRGFHHHSDP